MGIEDLAGIGKVADSKLANTAYTDAAQKSIQETGQLLSEIPRTARMVLQPLFTAIQGSAKRVDDWVARAFASVPEERRVPADPRLLSATVQAIAVEDDASELRSNYVKLLASMVDRDCRESVHPAFPKLLQEMSPMDAIRMQLVPNRNILADSAEFANCPPVAAIIVIYEADFGLRFLVPVDQFHVTTSGPDRTRTPKYFGLMELRVPHKNAHHDRLGFDNLKRLNLVDENTVSPRLMGFQNAILDPFQYYMFDDDPRIVAHIKYLTGGRGYRIQGIFSRSWMGSVFCDMCVPDFAGEMIWHPLSTVPVETLK